MLRIVGVQRSHRPHEEFVLLQNQGGLRLPLRGHAVVSAGGDDANPDLHLFIDSETIPVGSYILLSTGHGRSRWGRSKDGQHVYHTFMNRDRSVWDGVDGEISVMSVQHTFSARREATPRVMQPA